MLRRSYPFWFVLLALLALGLVAAARPGGSARPGGEATEPVDGKPAPDAPEADRADDLGGPPPARSGRPAASGRARPSPLNPEAREFPDGAEQPPLADYDRLLADIAKLRARVAALTTTLFASKLRVIIHTAGSDMSRVTGLRVRLDDGVIFIGKPGFTARDARTVYEHSLAPGQHVLGVEIERKDARNSRFRSLQGNRMTVVVPDKKLLEVRVDLRDDSDMAELLADAYGQYDLRTRLVARIREP